jgi:hypothetical protein
MVTATMVGLDAAADQPRIVSTFTTRDRVTPDRLRELTAQILRLIRTELGPVRCCSFLEFTTGAGPRSGGVRRPHLHTLWKDAGPEAAPVIAGIAGHVLERGVGAWRHDVEEIRSPAGATMYVARHHLKESQAPPRSWSGTRRVRPTRGYWSRPSKELRDHAKAIVRQKRTRARIERLVDEAEDAVGDDLTHVRLDLVEKALTEPPPAVVRVCKPWEDSLGRG